MTDTNPMVELMGRLPEPGVEASLAGVRLGMIPAEAVVATLADWPLFVLTSRGAPRPDPLVIGDGQDAFVIAFTSPDRIGPYASPERESIRLTGRMLAVGTRGGAGIWINPKSEPSLLIAPDSVVTLREAASAAQSTAPGSRPLTPLEGAIIEASSGRAGVDAVRAALPRSTVTLLSSTDPASGEITPQYLSVGERPRLVAWTDPALRRTATAEGWALEVAVDALPGLLGERPDLLIDPSTAFQFLLVE